MMTLLLTKIAAWAIKHGGRAPPLQSAALRRSSMSPISQERVEFSKDRIKVLNAMFRELTRRRQLFGANPQHIQSAIDMVLTERLSLQLETEIISNYLSAVSSAQVEVQ